jgi:putative ABC transport system permease protein
MLHNYLITTLRNLRRNKLFTTIHLAGLSIGMAGCILIALFIQDEMRYVEHHRKGDRTYRVLHESDKTGGGKGTVAWTSAALAPALRDEFPEVESAARLLDDWWVWVKHEDRKRMLDIALGDASLLDMFDIELIGGNPNTVFDGMNSAVITERVARRFYDDADPIGKTIVVEDDKLGGATP